MCLTGGGWTALSGEQFAYDSVGNRVDKNGAYLTGNRITQFDGCSYTTDDDGNVRSRTCGGQTVTFRWTAEGRLDTLGIGGVTFTFDYDAGGRLVRRKMNGTPVAHFLWDGAHVLAELTGAGTAAVAEYSYYPGLDNPHAIVVSGEQHNAHVDPIGNVIALTNGSQQLSRTYAFDAWGKLTGGNDIRPFGSADRARFKGALWLGPEVDVYYMRARWYEPKSGRFLSEDPIGLAGGINNYVFGADDPVNNADPTGKELIQIGDVYFECHTFGSATRCHAVGLGGITVEGAGGDPSWPGFPDDPWMPPGLGNPGSGDGPGGGGGPSGAPTGHPEGPSCGEAVALALGSLALDVAFFATGGLSGIVQVVRGGTWLGRGLVAGTWYGRQSLARLGSQAVSSGAAQVGRAWAGTRGIGVGAAAALSGGGTALTREQFSLGGFLRDLTPVVGTFFAAKKAVAACR